VLAFADPALGSDKQDAGFRGALPWVEGLRLGPLPHAREEAAAIVRRLGGKSRLLQGDEATPLRARCRPARGSWDSWAGLVVLGDGDLVPYPGGLPRPPSFPVSLIPVLLTLIGLAWIVRRRTRAVA